MTFSTIARGGLLALGLGLFVACSTPEHSTGDASQTGIIESDKLQFNEIKAAVDDLTAKVSRKAAKGWPPHVALSPDDGAPLVRITKLTKKIPRGSSHGAQMSEFRDTLFNALAEQDVMICLTSEGAMAETAAEREQYEFDSGNAAKFDPDQATFVLRANVTLEKAEGSGSTEGMTQYTYTLALKLWDTTKDRLVVATSTRMRKNIRE